MSTSKSFRLGKREKAAEKTVEETLTALTAGELDEEAKKLLRLLNLK